MSARRLHLPRLAKAIQRHTTKGWQRAVFSRPGADDDAEVLEGPADLSVLIQASAQAAEAGRVKQVIVLDETTRVRIDARYGKAKIQSLDTATKRKVMGGKARPLQPDGSADLLRVIGIMNADGTISTKSAKKYKQVNHFVELCRPAWQRLLAHRKVTKDDPLRVLDVACGNGYLTFVLAEALRLAELPTALHGIDLREDVIDNCRARASALGWEQLRFEVGRIGETSPAQSPDIMLALHACDTATDEALALGIEHQVSVLLVAPCCQREVAAQLDTAEATAEVPALVRHGLLRREYASTLTDALRVEVLDACGYKVDVVEFVESTHSAKNLLLRAHRRPGAAGRIDHEALDRIRARCEAMGIQPSVLARLPHP